MNNFNITSKSPRRSPHVVFVNIILACTVVLANVALLPCSAFAQTNPVRIMPLGDSITYDQQIGDTRPLSVRTGYREPLWQMLINAGYYVDFVGGRIAGQDALPSFDPDNEGYPGFRDDEIALIVYDLLVSNPADAVLLHIGTNGVNSNPSDVENILNEIDRFETDFGIPITVFLARIINRSTYSATTTDFNNNVEAMAQLRISNGDDIVIVDMENGAGIDYNLGPVGDMFDNLHPNDNGYFKMANKWMEALSQNLILPPGPVAPVINTIPAQTTAYIGELYSYNLVANGSPTLTFSLTDAPTGMTIDSTSGRIEWTPSQEEITPVTVTVSNGVIPDATQNFQLNVEAQPPPTVLNSGEIQSGTVAEGQWVYYQIDATSADIELVVELTNLSDDVDLYVLNGAEPTTSSFDCRPYKGGTQSETCTLPNTANTTWYIGIYGYSAGNFNIRATLTGATILVSGQTVAGNVAQGEWEYYVIDATAQNVELMVELSNLSSDVDLYVLNGALPTTSSYDCRPYLGQTNSETCTLPNSGDTTWYIGVRGYTAGSYSVTATLTTPGGNQPPVLAPIGAQTVEEGQQLLVPISASDVDGPAPLLLSAPDMPPDGILTDFGDGTGEFIWTPAIGAAASSPYTVTFSATDDGGNGLSDSEPVTITVTPAGGGGGPIVLNSGESQAGSVAQDEWQYYVIDTSAADSELVVELTNLSSDVDLYVRNGIEPTLTTYDCRPYKGQTNAETCILPNTGSTTWYIGVHGYTAGSFMITATVVAPTTLDSGVSQPGSVVQGEWEYYVINATAADTQLVVDLTNLSADVDLYVLNGTKPTLGNYVCRPYLGSTNAENCTLANTGDTTWYIGVHGFRTGNYTVTATLF